MKALSFTFDEEANGWLSEPFTVQDEIIVHADLCGKAPIVTLKQEPDGGYAIYGQSPKESDRYKIHLISNEEVTLKLATPVEVTQCYIIN